MSLRWAHMPFCLFCHEASQTATMYFKILCNPLNGNVPKFSDSHVWANSVALDQTAPPGLHCLAFHLHLLDSLFYGNATVF